MTATSIDLHASLCNTANLAAHAWSDIVGTASPERILQNIREIEEPLDNDLLAGVLEILQPIHNLTWPSGRVENN